MLMKCMGVWPMANGNEAELVSCASAGAGAGTGAALCIFMDGSNVSGRRGRQPMAGQAGSEKGAHERTAKSTS